MKTYSSPSLIKKLIHNNSSLPIHHRGYVIGPSHPWWDIICEKKKNIKYGFSYNNLIESIVFFLLTFSNDETSKSKYNEQCEGSDRVGDNFCSSYSSKESKQGESHLVHTEVCQQLSEKPNVHKFG